MDGPWVSNLLEPHNVGNSLGTVTLTTTAQILCPTNMLPNLANWFNYVGKALHIKGVGWTTTGATPGNLGWSILYGPNTNNVGSNIASVLFAGTNNSTTSTFMFDLWVRCQATGTNGTLCAGGVFFSQSQGLWNFNFSGSPIFTGCDLTTSAYMSPQLYRTGSTAEQAAILDIWFESLN
jgi:hypothetical protein